MRRILFYTLLLTLAAVSVAYGMQWFNSPGGIATSVRDTDMILIEQNGVSRAITRAKFLEGIARGTVTPVFTNNSSAKATPVTFYDASSGTVTITLRDTDTDLVIAKSDTSANSVVILPSIGRTIMWDTSYSLTLRGESVHLRLTGTNWYKI